VEVDLAHTLPHVPGLSDEEHAAQVAREEARMAEQEGYEMRNGTLVQVVGEPALPDSMILNGKLRDSWQIFFYLVGAFGMGIAVSLATPRVPEHQLERVFRALRTPVQAGEPHHAEPFVIPDGVEVPEPNKLIDHPDFEIPKPTTLGVGGFVLLWACVGILIGFVYWMAGLGA
jgi:hypothetical protein